MAETEEIISQLKSQANETNRKGMARYGICTDNCLGVPLPYLRGLAKSHRNNHILAMELWESGIHEARILATMIDVPEKVTEEQMEKWVLDFDSWDTCDACCSNLFDKTPFVFKKIVEWTAREEEYVRRAGFVLMACLAVHDKKLEDKVFLSYFPLIIKYAADSRNFVRKAVNWALRQIGKRNQALYNEALKISKDLMSSDDKTARWIGSDACRELIGDTAIRRMKGNQMKIEQQKSKK